ncbi:MAG: hypothetical protein WBF43_06315 [Methylocella sp.]
MYVNNSRPIEDEAREAAKSGQSTFPAYVFQQFSRDIAACWNEVPLLANEAVQVEDALRPSMEAVLEAVLSNALLVHIVAFVEALIKSEWILSKSRRILSP